MKINEDVVNGFSGFDMSPAENAVAPQYASPACLSEAMQALWTNRIPKHEPWSRVMQGDTTPPPNTKNDECTKNVHHFDQFDNTTSPAGIQPIGRIEGNDEITRNIFWRR